MKIRTFISFMILPLLSIQATAQSPQEIIKKSENQIKGKTSYGIIEMTIITPDFKRTLKMEGWWIGNEKALIEIKYPKKEEGNKTLKIGKEIWLYLRNTESLIKIPPSMMLQSWNGSDFTYDDLVRESNLERDYEMKIISSSDTVNSEICWKIELIPKPQAPVVWGKIIYWVRKSDYLPARIDYYDEKGKLVRYMEFYDVKEFHSKKLPAKWVMYNNIEKGRRTEFTLIDIKFDIKIDEKIFSFKELEKRR
ncbi:outer membrane lipoprotein-sorting protein [Candidatus Kryptobacter tengchongensis]|uniref:Outer membrane lipoprotein-sorting protein n=1 Tax=Kryptobacter tengchongensis TaxID=1643429 RepID=A0A656D3V4_KRYT1|nr:outer membrane lipoprotein-sorting protein [Candidatus Kryptobacter tengchongensis]CUS97474.1 Outer membrane lipoprotein-sorting protein [Candidatus Kryptobacter tengchongensis]